MPTTVAERVEASRLAAVIDAQDQEAGVTRTICFGGLDGLREAAANPPRPEGPTA